MGAARKMSGIMLTTSRLARRPHRLILSCAACLLPSAAWAGAAGGGRTTIWNIAVSMVAASLFGFVAKVLRQPLLLGYMLAGVAVGPLGLELISERSDIETLSQIGLILLLFMIGLEIDLKRMFQAGRLVVVTGLVQFPISVALAAGILWLLSSLGLDLGQGPQAVLYLAVAVSISSTMIVVKLLYDKRELDTLAGRITVGILVFQDIWAIVVLAIQPNLADPRLLGLLRTFGAGAVLVAASLLLSKYVLPRVFHVVAKIPELMLVLSLGWCFLVGVVAAHPAIGLSMEMGALIAGVSLATFPYNIDVNAKVLNIRDFFITLFFVSLGMQITVPRPGVVGVACAVVAVLLLTRLVGVFGVLHALKAGHWSSILPTINLAQMSEFALVILALGVSHGHVGADTLAIGVWAFAISAVGATYLIAYSHVLERIIRRVLSRLGLADLRASVSEVRRAEEVLEWVLWVLLAYGEELGLRPPEFW